MRDTLRTLSCLALLALPALALPGCAGQRLKFENLGKRDQLRYAACRHDVARRICPDDPDCDIKAGEMYAGEPAHARLQWLLDYNCPKDKIQHADDALKEQERGSIGLQ